MKHSKHTFVLLLLLAALILSSCHAPSPDSIDTSTDHRTITTRAFEGVTQSSMSTDKISVTQLSQAAPTPEQTESLWSYTKYNGQYLVTDNVAISGSYYSQRYEYQDNGADVNYLEKFEDGSLAWSTRIDTYNINGFTPIEDGVLVYGEDYGAKGADAVYLSRLRDRDGEILWTTRIPVIYTRTFFIADVLENPDGTIAVIGRWDFKYLCLIQYSSDGKELRRTSTDIGDYGVSHAVHLGDGYLVMLFDNMKNQYAKLMTLDAKGEVTGGFSYESSDTDYHITDMIEFNGKIYLSAYSLPKNEQNSSDELRGLRGEIPWDITSEQLTPMIRDQYTAILLVCSPDDGKLKKMYAIEGSVGGALTRGSERNLEWDVESIDTTKYSPATSAFSVYGVCRVFRYTFNKKGELVSQHDTGKAASFSR